MEVEQLPVAGAVLFTPRQHRDRRGVFLEQMRADALQAALGHPLALAQANVSVSTRGVVRGIHFADVPPGQAKYVTCVQGAVLDMAVDLRVGSPTFARHAAVVLDDVDRRALYLAEGLGHAFMALTGQATVSYLCSTAFDPEREHRVSVFDPDLALPWPAEAEPLLSDRDRTAPSLRELRAADGLPDFTTCEEHYARLREAGGHLRTPSQAGRGQ